LTILLYYYYRNFSYVSTHYKYDSILPYKFPHQITEQNLNQAKQKKKLFKYFQIKTSQVKMNPITTKPVVIVTSEVTEEPINPTNQCSIM
jgi:hypothetical protein